MKDSDVPEHYLEHPKAFRQAEALRPTNQAASVPLLLGINERLGELTGRSHAMLERVRMLALRILGPRPEKDTPGGIDRMPESQGEEARARLSALESVLQDLERELHRLEAEL